MTQMHIVGCEEVTARRYDKTVRDGGQYWKESEHRPCRDGGGGQGITFGTHKRKPGGGVDNGREVPEAAELRKGRDG